MKSNQTKLLLTFFASILLLQDFAQIPQKFNYQAVVRNASGVVLSNQNVAFKLSLTSSSETVYYSETQTAQTSTYGVVELIVGNGTPVEGTFGAVQWANGVKFKIEIDPAGGTSYVTMGIVELLSVPFAQVAGNGIVSITDNSNGTFTYNFLNGSQYTTPNLTGPAGPVGPAGPLVTGTQGQTLVHDGASWAASGKISVEADTVGIGTNASVSKLIVKGESSALPEDPIFEVRNKDNKVVFGVYNEGVRVYVEDAAKGAKGGFAVGGLTNQTKESKEYFRITPDSARIWVKDATTKGRKGGFAVGGLTNQTKPIPSTFLDLTPENYFIGHDAGMQNVDGIQNSFIGYQSGKSNTSGYRNVFLGYQSGFSNIYGKENIFIGSQSGYLATGVQSSDAGSFNVFLGTGTGYNNTTGAANIFLGFSAGTSNTTGTENIFLGINSGMRNVSGRYNLFLGSFSGFENVNGNNNVFLGNYSGHYNTSGLGNIFIGPESGRSNTTGNNNIAIGNSAGYHLKVGSNNTILGSNAGSYPLGSGNVLIGYHANTSDSTDNKLVISNQPTDSPLIWGDFNLHHLKFNSGVSVGYGCDIPTQALDVFGNARLRGHLFDSFNSLGTEGQVLGWSSGGIRWQTTPKGYGNSGELAFWSASDSLGSNPFVTYSNSLQIQSVPIPVNEDDPIFEVKNKDGQVVFGVYQGGVRIYVEDSQITKGAKGGFAVGGLTNQSKGQVEYFRITPDSARIYVKEVPAIKGAKGGFAVGGLTNQVKTIVSRDLMFMSPDSARIWIKESTTKGAKGGFAVGGLTNQSKLGNNEYFNVSSSSTPIVVNDNAQMLWYPLKEAFLVGRVQVLDPADVGLNSFSSGYHSKAMGDYSQAIGTNCVASGQYSAAIGETSVASGQYSFAFGSQAQATNTNNVAIGKNALSAGNSNSYAFGNSSQVVSGSINSYAFGNSSIVTGSTDSYSFGTSATVKDGLNSYAIGSNANVSYETGFSAWGSYAIGDHAKTYGQRAYAIGSYAQALANDAIALGTNAKSTAYTSIAIGANGTNADTTYATGQGSLAIGYAANADSFSSLSIGTRSQATGDQAIGLGYQANASAIGAVAFGSNATASGTASFALGMDAQATATNSYAIGRNAVASGDNSIAFGSAANTNSRAGSFVFGDASTGDAITSNADNQFLVRASGGVTFYSNSSLASGVSISAGGGAWNTLSDANKKENFRLELPQDFLDKLENINIQSWNYISQDKSVRHIGITAQDFYKYFGYGEDDKTISTVDLDGVNMIAIKGLIDRNNSLSNKIEMLEKEQVGLKSEVDKLNELLLQYENLKAQLEELKKVLTTSK